MRSLWRWFKARFRLDLDLVCEMSKGKGLYDYHDLPDDELGGFLCHLGTLRCTRCGKEFTI